MRRGIPVSRGDTMIDTEERCEVEAGSGNVFIDLGLPDADELTIKADILVNILRIIKARKLTQKKAAEIIGIDQPGVSNLMHCKIRGYSTERLLKILAALGNDVEIRIKSASGRHDHAHGSISVVAF